MKALVIFLLFFVINCGGQQQKIIAGTNLQVQLNRSEYDRYLLLKKVDRIVYQIRKKLYLCKKPDSCHKLRRRWQKLKKILIKPLEDSLKTHPKWYPEFVKSILANIYLEISV
ncbi:MAG: hypothetical protein ACQES9_01900 [Myxococcota bacterium]